MNRVKLEELVSSGVLREALERMRMLPEHERPYVIVDDTVTKRFVQFCGGFGAALRIDVPVLRNVVAPAVATELLGESNHLNDDLWSHTKVCASVAEAEQLAVRVLTECLGLPGIADLTVTESPQSKN